MKKNLLFYVALLQTIGAVAENKIEWEKRKITNESGRSIKVIFAQTRCQKDYSKSRDIPGDECRKGLRPYQFYRFTVEENMRAPVAFSAQMLKQNIIDEQTASESIPTEFKWNNGILVEAGSESSFPILNPDNKDFVVTYDTKNKKFLINLK